MSFSERLLKFIAKRFHVPGDALDYFFASTKIGRPAETLFPFPAELIPIGARLVLRGWINDAFFPTNLDWILPYWATRQFDPQDPAFVAYGLNLYTINYTHRDWTMIGNLAREREAIVDPRGLVTPWLDGWSLDVWLEVDGRLYAPSRLADSEVEQSLRENLPIVATAFRASDLSVQLEAFATEEEEGGEWIVEEIAVQNLTSRPVHATLYLSVRPFNPEGVSLVRKLSCRPLGEQSVFLIDDAVGLVLPKADGIACSNYAKGDVALALPALNGETRVEDATGLATAVAAYHLELGAGATKALAVRMPEKKLKFDESAPDLGSSFFSLTSPAQARTRTVAAWRDVLAQGMRVRLPDQKLQDAFQANQAFLLLFHDGNTITPGPFTYHRFWFRDAAYLLNALDKLGYHAQARQVIDRFPLYLEKDGYLRATEGEWDSNGAAIWAMVENARLSGDFDLVAKYYWSLLRMASWINSKRRQNTEYRTQNREYRIENGRLAHYGLLPAGPSAEHLGPSDYYYWDDFWGLAGLNESAHAAEWLGQPKDAAKLRANFESFRRDVDASLAGTAARLGRPAMPASPYRRLDSGMIGNLVALYPLRLFAPDDPRITDTLAALKEKAWVDGSYFNSVGHAAFGTYLSLHVAECYLYARNPEAWKIIQWVLEHASPTFTWAEGLHPITLRGGMGDGHHGWAAADFLIAIRNALLFEEGDHLVITPILPEEWTVENNVIKVEDAPTYFGQLSYTIAFGERTGTLVVDGDWRKAPDYIEWDLPFALREAGGDVQGVEIVGNSVRLPRGVERVVVMW